MPNICSTIEPEPVPLLEQPPNIPYFSAGKDVRATDLNSEGKDNSLEPKYLFQALVLIGGEFFFPLPQANCFPLIISKTLMDLSISAACIIPHKGFQSCPLHGKHSFWLSRGSKHLIDFCHKCWHFKAKDKTCLWSRLCLASISSSRKVMAA